MSAHSDLSNLRRKLRVQSAKPTYEMFFPKAPSFWKFSMLARVLQGRYELVGFWIGVCYRGVGRAVELAFMCTRDGVYARTLAPCRIGNIGRSKSLPQLDSKVILLLP